MPIRILHTADNHIGLSFQRLPERVRERLLEERFAALGRVVDLANARKAHFLVVAGDLFDKLTVSSAQVGRTVDLLKRFEGTAVLVLAGNHDYCEGPDSKLWQSFRKRADDSNVFDLTEARSMPFEVDEGRVCFYPCPCPSKTGTAPMTGWVAAEAKEDGVVHIGIAHGNVEGLGLDVDQRYFNMTEAGLREAGVHTWLLGHIHVPFPAAGTVGRPLFFMPGIHTPDSVRCTHPGHAWYIELSADGSCRHEQLTTGAVRFHRINATLEHATDIAALEMACHALDAADTVLDLQLTGRLDRELRAQLNTLLDALGERFLHLSRELDVQQVLTAEEIGAQFPEGTLPHALLHALLADTEHPGDAHEALGIIQAVRTP